MGKKKTSDETKLYMVEFYTRRIGWREFGTYRTLRKARTVISEAEKDGIEGERLRLWRMVGNRFYALEVPRSIPFRGG